MPTPKMSETTKRDCVRSTFRVHIFSVSTNFFFLSYECVCILFIVIIESTHLICFVHVLIENNVSRKAPHVCSLVCEYKTNNSNYRLDITNASFSFSFIVRCMQLQAIPAKKKKLICSLAKITYTFYSNRFENFVHFRGNQTSNIFSARGSELTPQTDVLLCK